MGAKTKKIISAVMALIMCVCLASSAGAFSYPDGYPNTHRNTGHNIADLISVAKSQIGYTELSTRTGYPLSSSQDGGYTKYGASFGDPTGAWCAYFVSWCAIQAGISTSVVPRIGNCQTAVNWYKNHSEFYSRSTGYSPKTGDIIFYNWSGGSSAQHIGIITGVSGNSIYTIEGNTDSSLGYRCAGKTRNRSASYIVGYGVPNYNDASTYVGSYSFASSVAGNSVSNSDSIAYTTSKLAIVTTTATNITSSNATLNGSVVNGGRLYITTAGFYFGTDKNALKKLAQSYNTSKSSVALTADVNKAFGTLMQNTTYYYRSFATIDGRDYLGPTYAVVTVNDQPQQLVLSEKSVNVGIGQTAEVMAAQLPVGSKDEGITWTSPDKNVATVTNEGIITGVGYGSVSLTAKTNYGSVSAKCDVSVLIATPMNVQLINTSKTSITVKWDAVDGAKGYVLYRAEAADAEFVEYKTLDADETSFTDKNLETGKKYYYRIMTLAELEKYNSDMTDTLYTAARLSTPEITQLSHCLTASIRLKWNEVDDAKSYTIYRCTSEDGLYTIIGSTSETEFIDVNTVGNQKYFYKIVASDDSIGSISDYSRTKSISPDIAIGKPGMIPIKKDMLEVPEIKKKVTIKSDKNSAVISKKFVVATGIANNLI